MKNFKLLQVFYIYGCILLVFQILAVGALTVFILYLTFVDKPLTKGSLAHQSVAWHYLMYASTFYASLILDIYVILLVKTEIMKIKDKNQYTLEDVDEVPKTTVTYTKKEGEEVAITSVEETGY
ncbi:uncharacterized protein LOC111356803 [Spodoptera litura]|uniref:Uncharacterized protein LOC111356803 n=1 Tax=Spodoptera litura TaxID=69820 RepID=A0A9J7EFH5_SPOLT|nr:uncharacterized protein LOC111356803 [Spodoptera litura]